MCMMEQEDNKPNLRKRPARSKQTIKTTAPARRQPYDQRKYKLSKLKGPFRPNHSFVRIHLWPAEDRKAFKKAFTVVMGKDFMSSDGPSEEQYKTIHSYMSDHVCLEEIKYYVLRAMHHIQKHRKRHDEPIDKWVELLDAVSEKSDDLEQQLSSSVLVATEESISDTTTTGPTSKSMPEPDYDAAYRYIACAISNTPLPKLSPPTALLIEDCLQSLAQQIKTLDDGELRLNLRRAYRFFVAPEDVAIEDNQEEIASQLRDHATLFNPLGINQNSIIPVPPDKP